VSIVGHLKKTSSIAAQTPFQLHKPLWHNFPAEMLQNHHIFSFAQDISPSVFLDFVATPCIPMGGSAQHYARGNGGVAGCKWQPLNHARPQM
jgi:hypothetical protein